MTDAATAFTIKHKQLISEYDIEATLYKHNKTGAEIFFLKSNNENKLFSVGFKTLPHDSTGVAHILEHSVLCGSRKYPLKDPFATLLKTSLHTFLNAFTWSDKTVYPFTTKNDKDFDNIMDVYLDTVFYPGLDEKVFKQEGWHYEIGEDGRLFYKGVVFNEMKGAFSDPENVLEEYVIQAGYPDIPVYTVNSGGDPLDIPHLTYDEFLSFHKTFYHPSNAQFIIAGNVDINDKLYRIDAYLKEFEPLALDTAIPQQEAFTNPVIMNKNYLGDEAEGARCIAVSTWNLGEPDRLDQIGLEILDYILIRSSASPLRKALLDTELGESLLEIHGNPTGACYLTELKNPLFVIGLKGVQREEMEKVERVIMDTLTKQSRGIALELVEAGINKVEFTKREIAQDNERYPQEIKLLRWVFSEWNYGRDPFEALSFEKEIKHIRNKIAEGEPFFENLIKRYLLNTTKKAVIRITPDPEFTQKRDEIEQNNLKRIKNELSEQQLDEISSAAEQLKQWQQTPDSEEARNAIPQLALQDIPKETMHVPTEIEHAGKNTFISHPTNTNGVVYLDFGFDLSEIDDELLFCLNVLGKCYQKLGTKAMPHDQVALAMDTYTGALDTKIYTTSTLENESKEVSKFFITLTLLEENVDKALDTLTTILNGVDLSDTARIKQVLKEMVLKLEPQLISEGHKFTMRRMTAHFSASSFITEHTSGITFYKQLKDLIACYDTQGEDFVEKLTTLHKKLINGENVVVNITATKTFLPTVKDIITRMLGTLASKTNGTVITRYPRGVAYEFFAMPSSVNYVGECYTIERPDNPGTCYVANVLLCGDYMWNRVRMQGGAYGAWAKFDLRNNTFMTVSYRDPNTCQTITVYRELPEYLATRQFSKKEIEGAVISTVGSLDSLLLPYEKGWAAMDWYLTGYTDEIRQAWRDDVLSCTVEELQQLGMMLKKAADKEKSIVIIGDRNKAEHSCKKHQITFTVHKL
ncbi:MAG: insulinase family protein [Candidatus Dojkabacteria bacterium]